MKKTIGIAAFLAIFCAGAIGVRAQSHEDILRFSRYNYGFGTARSAAMGGAFASLGADLSAMTLNPAGLGMYRGSEFSLSPSFSSLSIASTNVVDGQGTFKASMNKNRLSLNGIGAAFNLYAGSGGLTSVTFGFNYNKLADLDGDTRVVGRSNGSMLDMFIEQLSNRNVNPDDIGGHLDNGTFPGGDFGMLGAMQAYDAYLMNKPVADAGGLYSYGLNDQLSSGAIVHSDFRKQTQGVVGQYDLGMGFNVSNILYLGFGLGLQDLYYKETADYYESFEGNAAPTPTRVENWNYVRTLEQTGSAWNFKIGAIVRPLEALRIGLAFHTPTYISLNEHYVADVYGRFAGTVSGLNSNQSHNASVAFQSTYNMRTPMRFIGGISYNFFNTAILSLDYERVWYNQMKMFWNGWNDEDTEMTSAVKNEYKPANNLRVGLETMVAPNLFTRVGYAYYDSMYKSPSLKKYGKTSNYSVGFGYRTGSLGLDLAYIYMDAKTAPARTYDYTATTDGTQFRSGLFDTKQLRHNVTLTASVRF